ncbi:hypothetical protein IAT38_004817 [Cryptococcus sp. DSM 104549]
MSLLRPVRTLRAPRLTLLRAYSTPLLPLPPQNPKPHAFANPRFEQTAWQYQPNQLSAMGLVAEDPVRLVNGRIATCDGGGGALGHPKIFINLDKPGPKVCGYCGVRYEQSHEHHH